MANKKISDLTAGSALTGAELIEIEQSSSSAKAALNGILKTYLDTLYAPNWSSDTPTFTGFGTVSGVTYYSKLEADGTLHAYGTFTCGTRTAVEARISLRHNGADLTSVSTYPTLQLCGKLTQDSNSFDGNLLLIEASKTYLTVGREAAGTYAGLSKQTADNIAATGSVISFEFKVRTV